MLDLLLVLRFPFKPIKQPLIGLFLQFISIALLSTPNVLARDLTARLGVGYNSEFSNTRELNGVPALSIKYALTKEVAFAGVFGISTGSPSNSLLGAKLFKNIFYETNLNFYYVAGGGLLSANGKSGFELLGGMGVEFFIPGLESIGFSSEFGGSVNTASGKMSIQTLGASFIHAGMHFYF